MITAQEILEVARSSKLITRDELMALHTHVRDDKNVTRRDAQRIKSLASKLPPVSTRGSLHRALVVPVSRLARILRNQQFRTSDFTSKKFVESWARSRTVTIAIAQKMFRALEATSAEFVLVLKSEKQTPILRLGRALVGKLRRHLPDDLLQDNEIKLALMSIDQFAHGEDEVLVVPKAGETFDLCEDVIHIKIKNFLKLMSKNQKLFDLLVTRFSSKEGHQLRRAVQEQDPNFYNLALDCDSRGGLRIARADTGSRDLVYAGGFNLVTKAAADKEARQASRQAKHDTAWQTRNLSDMTLHVAKFGGKAKMDHPRTGVEYRLPNGSPAFARLQGKGGIKVPTWVVDDLLKSKRVKYFDPLRIPKALRALMGVKYGR